jgi:hypothetical protein
MLAEVPVQRLAEFFHLLRGQVTGRRSRLRYRFRLLGELILDPFGDGALVRLTFLNDLDPVRIEILSDHRACYGNQHQHGTHDASLHRIISTFHPPHLIVTPPLIVTPLLIVTAGPLTLIVYAWLAVALSASVTVTVNAHGPPTVGAPLSTPPLESLNPKLNAHFV